MGSDNDKYLNIHNSIRVSIPLGGIPLAQAFGAVSFFPRAFQCPCLFKIILTKKILLYELR
jgi:hypothetical protein